MVVLVGGMAILGLRRVFSRIRGLDALSAFALYLFGFIALGALGLWIGKVVEPALNSLLGHFQRARFTNSFHHRSAFSRGASCRDQLPFWLACA